MTCCAGYTVTNGDVAKAIEAATTRRNWIAATILVPRNPPHRRLQGARSKHLHHGRDPPEINLESGSPLEGLKTPSPKRRLDAPSQRPSLAHGPALPLSASRWWRPPEPGGIRPGQPNVHPRLSGAPRVSLSLCSKCYESPASRLSCPTGAAPEPGRRKSRCCGILLDPMPPLGRIADVLASEAF